MLDRVEIRYACRPVHTDDGLLLGVVLNHPGTMRSTVPCLIGEEYRIPIVISEVDVILCPVQTRLFVKSGQGNANSCFPRPRTTLPKTITNCLRGNVNANSIPELISSSSRIHEGMTSGLYHKKSVLSWRGCSLSTTRMALGS